MIALAFVMPSTAPQAANSPLVPEPAAELVPLSSWARGAKLVVRSNNEESSCSVRIGGGGGGLPGDAGRCAFLRSVPTVELSRLRGSHRGRIAFDFLEIQKVEDVFLPAIEIMADPPIYYRETRFLVDEHGKVSDCNVIEERGTDILHIAPLNCAPRQRYADTGSNKMRKVTIVVALSLWDRRAKAKEIDLESALR
ncbi:MAG: hypothetical protein ABIQ43_09365 [Sphingomonas sp.]